ncbi:MAG: twin-arginine translocase TatA/TatE family subunit [Sandaracinaceae bacterium]
MFGLGWLEILIIGGAIMLIAGPAALTKLMRTAQEIQKTKSDLMSGNLEKVGEVLDKMSGGEERDRLGEDALAENAREAALGEDASGDDERPEG